MEEYERTVESGNKPRILSVYKPEGENELL